MANKPIQGTHEWAVATVDCCLGCPNNCRYCYGKYDQTVKRDLLEPEDWSKCHVVTKQVEQDYRLYPGQVMFPANHDIFPENIDACLIVLKKLLAIGNKVLIVSKPRTECIEKLCHELAEWKSNILFRFTITARDNDVLSFWEPDASAYHERLACLQLAHGKGYETSVSIEPMLDGKDLVDMVHELIPFTSHSIWIGKMNKIDERVQIESEEEMKAVQNIENGQTDAAIKEIYNSLKGLSLIRWKESIKDVIGLTRPSEAGLDV